MAQASLIIRPEGKCQATVAYFEQAGLPALPLPLIEIKPIEDQITRLSRDIDHQGVDNVIFVSTNSAALMVERHSQPLLVPCFCVGKSTAEKLAKLAPAAIVPELETSEGLLLLPQLQRISQRKIAVAKGVGGRTLLKQELEKRGAVVESYDLYARNLVPKQNLALSLLNQPFEYVIVTSVELLKAAVNFLDKLGDKHWVVVSPRIADEARKLGVSKISLSPSARNEDLVASINYLEQQRGRK